MQYSRSRKRKAEPAVEATVYADLDALMRLRFKATVFSYLPPQPVHNLLSGRHSSRFRGRRLKFEELRNYLTGDVYSNIDWKVPARKRLP